MIDKLPITEITRADYIKIKSACDIKTFYEGWLWLKPDQEFRTGSRIALEAPSGSINVRVGGWSGGHAYHENMELFNVSFLEVVL